ncbi:MAG: hypothetical protein OHK0031_16720 [Anaerolineales bacterium]
MRRQQGIQLTLIEAGNALQNSDFSAALASYRQTSSLLGRQKRSGLPALAIEQLIQAAHARQELTRPRPQPAPRRWIWFSAISGALAASLGLLLIFSTWFLSRPAPVSAPPDFSQAGAVPACVQTLTPEASATPLPSATPTPLPHFSSFAPGTFAGLNQVLFWSAGEDITGVSFAPDGSRLVSSDSVGKIKIWGLWNDTPLMEIPGSKAAFSPDGRWLGIAGPQGLALYNAEDGSLARWLDQSRPYYAARFSPDSQILMGGANDTRFYAWSVNDGSKLQSAGGFTRAVSFFSFSKSSPLLVAGADDKVYVWNLQQQKVERSINQSPAPTYFSAALDPSGDFLATGQKDGQMYVWKIKNGERMVTFNDKSRFVHGLQFLNTTEYGEILISGDETNLSFWQISGYTYTLLRSILMPAPVLSLDISADNTLIATGGSDGVIRIWALTP